MLTGPGKQAQQQPVMWRDRYLLWGDVRLDAREDLQRQLEATDLDKHTPVTHEELFCGALGKNGAQSRWTVFLEISLWRFGMRQKRSCGAPEISSALVRSTTVNHPNSFASAIPSRSFRRSPDFPGNWISILGRLPRRRLEYRSSPNYLSRHETPPGGPSLESIER